MSRNIVNLCTVHTVLSTIVLRQLPWVYQMRHGCRLVAKTQRMNTREDLCDLKHACLFCHLLGIGPERNRQQDMIAQTYRKIGYHAGKNNNEEKLCSKVDKRSTPKKRNKLKYGQN